MDVIVYIHGKVGSAEEADHYRSLFPSCDVLGLDVQSSLPWEAGKQIHTAVNELKKTYDRVILIANSIGAFFAMNAGIEREISRAYFISPVVDMEKLIRDMMSWAGVTESKLHQEGVIHTAFGEDLSWEYLCYVRSHPISWSVPTDILYGSRDDLTSPEMIREFADRHHADLTVMEGGEHWFHTEEQMAFLDKWIRERRSVL
ncbi:MAG: alpha/beta hydrolase [Erysipelotrichaceae bacterium]|nr:alpha/beta hydrolase [Erysipelotrichaceae bacterium]